VINAFRALLSGYGIVTSKGPGGATALMKLEAVADVMALDGADPFDRGCAGRQWFSIRGVTEADRSARVLTALPSLLARLDLLAAERGVARKDLVLLGFS
jgi:phospholipase/carboxylesterase